MKKHTTIKDIARELGISTSTVSRALSGSWDVKEETRDLVRKTAETMHYHPNPMAVGLITKKSRTIGLVVPELQNSFFSIIINGIQRILNEAGYQLLITQSDESAEIENRNLQLLKNNMVDGIIISTTANSEQNVDLYNELINDGVPLVFFNRVCTKVEAPKIVINDVKMSFWAAEHLIYSGYKRIAHLSGPDDLSLTKERKAGYMQALRKHNMPINPDMIVRAGIYRQDGEEAMKRMLDAGIRPDAVFAFNDPVAIGAMREIKRRGLRIPDDIAMVGFSESRSALIVEPNLTTIAQPLIEMGEIAAQFILRQANGESVGAPVIELDAKLNIRESSRRD